MEDVIYLSTVTPVYNGAETLRELIDELDRLRQQLIKESGPLQLAESVFVDDGSTDGSDAVLYELSEKHDWIKVITFSRNFGQHPATMAGILHTSGDWVATLDEDLQHHPKFLLAIIRQAVIEKLDVVYAHPEASVHKSAWRDPASRGYKSLIAALSGNSHIKNFNSFRLIRACVARAAAAVASHQTYFDIALCWFTNRIGKKDLPLTDTRYAKEGRSGYTFRSLMRHAKLMIQSSNIKLLRFGMVLGAVAMLFSVIIASWALVIRLINPELIDLPGWASVFIAVTFFGGLNAFLSGLILGQQSLILFQALGQPNFFEINRQSDNILKKWFEMEKNLQ